MPQIPIESLKCVVPIGEFVKQVENTNDAIIELAGTGILLSYKGFGFVLTAKHVIQALRNPTVLVNRKDGGRGYESTSDLQRRFKEVSGLDINWIIPSDPEIDLAVLPFGLIGSKYDHVWVTPSVWADFDDMAEGDMIYFVGYPIAFFTQQHYRPVVRQGCVALKTEDHVYLIDGNVSAGNSGSSVFSRPSNKPTKFLGIVTEHLITSAHTTHPQIKAMENAGLGRVFSITHIKELINSKPVQEYLTEIKAKGWSAIGSGRKK